ncbi:MAG TPA: hypothetical protein VM122_09335 [Usitatibacter sp.]|nr:hypothetical protein [Usitatibacter sp.]
MECKYQELSTATSVAEIVHLTREYMSTWSVEELERLPDSCRPGRVKSPEDIETWADRLSAESARTTMYLDDERKLDRLTSHFLIASVRMRQIDRTLRAPLAA